MALSAKDFHPDSLHASPSGATPKLVIDLESIVNCRAVLAMDQITRDATIKALKEQLELCRIESASLDNDVARRSEMAQRSYAIKLLLEFMERKRGMQ